MRKQIALITVAAFITTLLWPAFAWADKNCPKCGKSWPDENSFCVDCGARLVSGVFGTPHLEEYLELWEVEGDVTLKEGVLCLSKNTSGRDRAFETTAKVKIGDESWTDYHVTGKIYFEAGNVQDSKLLATSFRDAPKPKYLGGGGTAAIFLKPGFEPSFRDYPDVAPKKYSALYEEKVETIVKKKRKSWALWTGIGYTVGGATALAVGGTVEDEESKELLSSLGPMAIGVGVFCFILYAAWPRKIILSRDTSGYRFEKNAAAIPRERWLDFSLRVDGNRSELSLNGLPCFSGKEVSSERGPLSFESIDGCKVYLDEVLVEDLSGE